VTLPGITTPKEFGRPRSAQGFFWYGGNDLPVRAQGYALTDRSTAAKWVLGVTPGLALQLTPAPSPLPTNATLYLPHEEPTSGGFRLFASNGALGFEPTRDGVSDPLIVLNVPGKPTKLGVVSLSASGIALSIITRP
jgi:hypothetical protein